ncbi:MAG: hypothetical protein ACRCW3_01450 [Metamycoplasmataceae bacterium]
MERVRNAYLTLMKLHNAVEIEKMHYIATHSRCEYPKGSVTEFYPNGHIVPISLNTDPKAFAFGGSRWDNRRNTTQQGGQDSPLVSIFVILLMTAVKLRPVYHTHYDVSNKTKHDMEINRNYKIHKNSSFVEFRHSVTSGGEGGRVTVGERGSSGQGTSRCEILYILVSVILYNRS